MAARKKDPVSDLSTKEMDALKAMVRETVAKQEAAEKAEADRKQAEAAKRTADAKRTVEQCVLEDNVISSLEMYQDLCKARAVAIYGKDMGERLVFGNPKLDINKEVAKVEVILKRLTLNTGAPNRLDINDPVNKAWREQRALKIKTLLEQAVEINKVRLQFHIETM